MVWIKPIQRRIFQIVLRLSERVKNWRNYPRRVTENSWTDNNISKEEQHQTFLAKEKMKEKGLAAKETLLTGKTAKEEVFKLSTGKQNYHAA